MRQAKISIRYNPTPERGEQHFGDPENHQRQAANAVSSPGYVSRIGLRVDDMPWFGNRVPNGYWDIREHRVRYLDWLGEQCGFVTEADWYKVRKHHFQSHSGGGLLRNEYGSSVLAAMCDYRPNYDWKPWLFGGAPNGFWNVRANRLRYMHWLVEQLGIDTIEGWYDVTGADFFNHHGGGLLNNQFRGSVQALLRDFNPDFDWKAWRFTSVPQSFWQSPVNRRNYMLWLGEQLGFRTSNDWRKLNREHFYRFEGSGLFVTHYHGSTQQAIAELFPEQVAEAS